jgi:hypothetical protein
VATTGAARAKENELPRSATITVRNGTPKPLGEVEVAPDIGRVHFKNKDKKGYRLRFSRENTEFSTGIDVLLPAKGTVTVMIKRHDVWHYRVCSLFNFGDALNGVGGGPIRN